mmetsp:Transcript_3531/g.7713  ORF Transcript_3531/g.7713 Transcript_3531/m.7713 type:complete len:286 (+) Transcript_3531:158-1015(+)|eukprot:CAMPEP_0201119290 /NCGR_PEP_ID=MMETSP0850-20130426/3445_1 /ASSEMBLY_ACC=CAM_ASM_000622 /TAXON_ID=183588 /ORGANISM="Pseudo-nitzschia fraudulenta, Strain WWA7" /LENGTH=285 /DNA_ID=CAMNT_0047384935 /DNA_START=87 /DNA_END=944 /DNA_ORIENTATION=-
MTGGQSEVVLTVDDLCINHSIDSMDMDESDGQSASEIVEEEDDDSFLANNSVCKQYSSTIQMLDSLRLEVVEMTRSDGKYSTLEHSPRDVTIDLNSTPELSSPLTSPTLERTILNMANRGTAIPILNNKRIEMRKHNTDYLRRCINSDDNSTFCSTTDNSTFCSMDNSIEHEMNALKEVAKDLEKELEAENLNTVFQAIERIGKSDDPTIHSVLMSGDKDLIREGIRAEVLNKQQMKTPRSVCLRRRRFSIVYFFWSIEGYSANTNILIASISFGLIRKFVSFWL